MSVKAKAFAIKHHGDQKYGNSDLPYIVHLLAVDDVLVRFGLGEDPVLRACALLHDVIEDTDATYEDVLQEFGREMADLVFAVTSEPGVNRKERNAKTYPKIRNHPKAPYLKLADRIANLEHSIQTGSNLYSMYLKEYAGFKNGIFDSEIKDPIYQALWAHLESLFT